MAHFRGTVQGNRSKASRLGSKTGGLTVEANGWDIGVRVEAHNGNNGKDYVRIYLTGGSNGSAQSICLGVFQRTETGFKQVGEYSEGWSNHLAESIQLGG